MYFAVKNRIPMRFWHAGARISGKWRKNGRLSEKSKNTGKTKCAGEKNEGGDLLSAF